MDTEKIFCQGTDPATLAMLNNSNNMNNPMWLIWLLAMRWMNGNCDGNNTSHEVESLRNQIADNKNSSDLFQALMNNSQAMQDIATRTGTSIDFVRETLNGINTGMLLGQKDMQSTFQQCCCDSKMATTTQGYESRIATMQMGFDLHNTIDSLRNAMTSGFAQVGFAAEQNKCAIIENQTANTQRLIDTMTQHWSAEQALALQKAELKLSQLEQNQYLVSTLKGSACGCGCN